MLSGTYRLCISGMSTNNRRSCFRGRFFGPVDLTYGSQHGAKPSSCTCQCLLLLDPRFVIESGLPKLGRGICRSLKAGARTQPDCAISGVYGCTEVDL